MNALNDIPNLIAASIVMLAFTALVTLVATRVKTSSISQIVSVGSLWILFVGLSVAVQYHLYQLRPSFYDENNGYMLWADIIVGSWLSYGVFEFIDDIVEPPKKAKKKKKKNA